MVIKTPNISVRLLLVTLIASLLAGGSVIPAEAFEEESLAPAGAEAKKDLGRKLIFEENRGQVDETAKFLLRGSGYSLFLTDSSAVFSLRYPGENSGSDRLEMKFRGANPHARVAGDDRSITRTNFYTRTTRLEDIPNFKRVVIDDLYEGISSVFYGNAENQLEYDLIVEPNADPNQIVLNFEGAESVALTQSGELLIKTANTALIQRKPIAFQIIDGVRKNIDVAFSINDFSNVAFQVGDYDRTEELTIDPVVSYSTYIGGSAFENIFEVAADNNGNAYISGDTLSLDFHGQPRIEDDRSAAFVGKINAAGTDFEYITILEGENSDLGTGITVDATNRVYVVGQATKNFPVTAGAFDTSLGGVIGDRRTGDGFAARLEANGTLDYATYIGGSAGDDIAFDVAVDAAGKAYVTGQTISGISFPQKNRYQGCGYGSGNGYDAYLTVLNAAGSDITYSTCIGGSVVSDHAFSIALDSSNNAYITGIATAGNFPTKSSFQAESGGGNDAFVAKFNPALSGESSLIYSTYLGGVGTDRGAGIAVNSSNQAVVVGTTGSANFPLANAFRSTNQVNEAFVSVLSSTGTSLVGSSFIGGADQDNALNVALGHGGLIYVTGQTLSNDFPLALPFQSTRRGVRDAFVTKVRFGTGIMSSSYLGGNGNDLGSGIAVKGNFIYIVGETASNNLATTSGVIKGTSTANAENPDGFVVKILDTQLDSVGVFRPSSTFVLTQSITNIVPQSATFTGGISGLQGVSGDWDGDGIDTIGSFANGVWKIRNANFPQINLPPPIGFLTISFGQAGDLPVVGDWNGDGIDTLGVFRPSAGQFLLTNSTNAANVDLTINFGLAGDLPIAGDWNADGIDSVGVFRPSAGQFFLTNANVSNPKINITAFFGISGDSPIAGDWDGNGTDTIGVSRPSSTEFFLSNDNNNIDEIFQLGAVGDQPIVGDWDGRPLP